MQWISVSCHNATFGSYFCRIKGEIMLNVMSNWFPYMDVEFVVNNLDISATQSLSLTQNIKQQQSHCMGCGTYKYQNTWIRSWRSQGVFGLACCSTKFFGFVISAIDVQIRLRGKQFRSLKSSQWMNLECLKDAIHWRKVFTFRELPIGSLWWGVVAKPDKRRNGVASAPAFIGCKCCRFFSFANTHTQKFEFKLMLSGQYFVKKVYSK